MAGGGDNDKGSTTGASDEQDGAVDARADHSPHTGIMVVDRLPALSIQPIDIPVLRLRPIEEDNSKDPFSHVQDYADEMKAASALTMMKHQVPVLQQRQMEQNPRQVEMEQNPRHMSRIPRRPRSQWVGWPRKRSGLRLEKFVLRLRSQGIL